MTVKVPLQRQISSVQTLNRLLEHSTAKSLNMRPSERSTLIHDLVGVLATLRFLQTNEANIKAALKGDKNEE